MTQRKPTVGLRTVEASVDKQLPILIGTIMEDDKRTLEDWFGIYLMVLVVICSILMCISGLLLIFKLFLGG
jgi:hypothetical protein